MFKLFSKKKKPEAVAPKRAVGNTAEGWVCDYLKNQGFRIVERNFYTAHGEIDIIAEDAKYIVFTEVKARSASAITEKYGRPARAVNMQKRKHILYSARIYLRRHPTIKCPRLDIAEVYIEDNSHADNPKYRIEYIKGAFGEGGQNV